MCEQTEISYLDGEVVWVKLGSCWWPGEVVAPEKLPPDVLPSFRKPPIAVVKFFQEDAYEYVKNLNSIYKYNCSRKTEFIQKGLYMYRTKHGHMEKFPEDVLRAEYAVGGDITILTRDEFQETKKESYANLFGDPAKKTPMSNKRGRGRGRPPDSSRVNTPMRKININKPNYKVHILVQGSQNTPAQPVPSETASTPSTSRAGSEPVEEIKTSTEQPVSTPQSTPQSTPKMSSSGTYSCHACNFTTSRLNVLILHNKTHSVTFMPYTPSPIKKKEVKTPKSSPNISKTPKPRKSRLEKTEKLPKKSASEKRAAEDAPVTEVKKAKTDDEIKSSLLADWDIDDDSNDESSVIVMTGSPEVAAPAESPAVATPADLPEAQVPVEPPTLSSKNNEDLTAEKPESSSDSKYEFCEDEDWPEEADIGRKIPRVKNPKRKEDTKSISLDDDEVAREVAELLNKTTVPELPSAPEPLKVEENFPEPSIVKSPDKKPEPTSEPVLNLLESKPGINNQPPKTIFKTKTFFRSRHSRSQDAIGKYVAEQLSAERMDMSEDINGSEILPSDTRISPPIVEPVKVARLAPKIQLKKMREKEKQSTEIKDDPYASCSSPTFTLAPVSLPEHVTDKDNGEKSRETDTVDQIKQNVANNVTQIELDHLSKANDVFSNQLHEESNFISSQLKEIDPKPTVEPDLEKDIQACLQENTSDVKENSSNNNENNSPIEKTQETDTDKGKQIKTETKEQIDNICEKDPEKNKIITSKNMVDEIEHEFENSNKNNNEIQITTIVTEVSEIKSQINEQSKSSKVETFMNESTVSAVASSSEIKSQINEQPKSESKVETFMNESTASAVDALLSVSSRETDKVTKNISNDLPEDLFEDDNKESCSVKNVNGLVKSAEVENNTIAQECDDNNQDVVCEEIVQENDKDISYTQESLLTKSAESSSDGSQNDQRDTVLENIETDGLESVPSESDLVIAETLINLPSTTIQNKPNAESQETTSLENAQFSEDTLLTTYNSVSIDNNKSNADESSLGDNMEMQSNHKANTDTITPPPRFETEQEKSENLNAAQSLVQMSESMEHKINVNEIKTNSKKEKVKSLGLKSNSDHELIINTKTVEKKSPLSTERINEPSSKTVTFETTSPKLLKILEEPCAPKSPAPNIITKQVIVPGKEKILNFDVGVSNKSHSPKQKIIIRRSNATNKNLLNNVTEVTTPDKIILSRSNNVPQDGSSVQTYTIQTATEAPCDPNTIIIQQKVRKLPKPPGKLQKVKPQSSLISPEPTNTVKDSQSSEDAMFDINSMPIVLSDDILTPESIEKMPIVMPDGNIITNPTTQPKLVKSKPTIIENEKIAISQVPQNSKTEFKTLLINPTNEVTKVTTTPNILSKSSKLRGTKMLVIDKTSGKQKIIMTKQAPHPEPPVKENKPQPSLIQPINQNAAKPEKFILIPSTASPRQGRTQKIVIDPQTGKAHLLVGKGPDSPMPIQETKPVSAKLMPSATDTPGNTVMIITNAQGTQSRIVLTPEHEKILFPNKQQPNISQLKTITHRAPVNPGSSNKSVVTTIASVKAPARIVPKQKSAIITSKGQLIVGGRVATTAQNIAPMPERTAAKRTLLNEPKKIIQTAQKNTAEPLILLHQTSGAVMQLTAAQFEHLQRTGQIIQKTIAAPARENKLILQKTIISPNETVVSNVPKPRVRKQAAESPMPIKKMKQDIPIAPAPTPVPALCPISNTIAPTIITPTLSTPATATASAYQNLENFEELLPSTAIARQPSEPAIPQPEPPAPPPGLSDGQLLAVPGEHFGGPAGSFYLCVEDNGTFTPIDNRPLVLENNQLVPMPEPVPTLVQVQPERRDILEAALANSDVFHGETVRDEAPDFRDLNANVSVHSRVSETSTTLNQPIMTPVEVPTKVDSEPAVPSNLEDGLAVIGVTPHTVPTSLELPITVTDPRIAPKTTDPLSGNNYGTALLPSPSTEMSFVTTEEVEIPVGGPISMPLLTEEESVGKSMPILTDDVSERIVSSVESTTGSPSSIDVRDGETDDGSQWSRRLLTPGSDTSELSAEIPLQPKIQLSVSDIK